MNIQDISNGFQAIGRKFQAFEHAIRIADKRLQDLEDRSREASKLFEAQSKRIEELEEKLAEPKSSQMVDGLVDGEEYLESEEGDAL